MSIVYADFHAISYGFLQAISLYRSVVFYDDPVMIMFTGYECYAITWTVGAAKMLMSFIQTALTIERYTFNPKFLSFQSWSHSNVKDCSWTRLLWQLVFPQRYTVIRKDQLVISWLRVLCKRIFHWIECYTPLACILPFLFYAFLPTSLSFSQFLNPARKVSIWKFDSISKKSRIPRSLSLSYQFSNLLQWQLMWLLVLLLSTIDEIFRTSIFIILSCASTQFPMADYVYHSAWSTVPSGFLIIERYKSSRWRIRTELRRWMEGCPSSKMRGILWLHRLRRRNTDVFLVF